MTARKFVDANVLVYAFDSSEPVKSAKAISILDQPDLAFSIQVFQEFYVQATRPRRPTQISHEAAVSFIQVHCNYPVQEMTVTLLMSALRTKDRYQISYWDAAIIEAARALGCTEVLSEDLNHGQDYGGVRVVNPFRDA